MRCRRWRRLIALGDAHQVELIRRGAKQVEIEVADEANVISSSDRGRLIDRVEAAVREANRRRELELVKVALDAARTHPPAAVRWASPRPSAR